MILMLTLIWILRIFLIFSFIFSFPVRKVPIVHVLALNVWTPVRNMMLKTNVWIPVRNMMLKTQSPYNFSLRNCVHFKNFKIEISKWLPIFSFLNLHQNYISMKWAESHKEQFGENQISISIFITEIW